MASQTFNDSRETSKGEKQRKEKAQSKLEAGPKMHLETTPVRVPGTSTLSSPQASS